MELVHAPIRVAAVFDPGHKIRPVWFDWKQKKYAIRETTYFWKVRDGDTLFLHFAVTDGQACYELAYNTADQNWTLVKMKPVD